MLLSNQLFYCCFLSRNLVTSAPVIWPDPRVRGWEASNQIRCESKINWGVLGKTSQKHRNRCKKRHRRNSNASSASNEGPSRELVNLAQGLSGSWLSRGEPENAVSAYARVNMAFSNLISCHHMLLVLYCTAGIVCAMACIAQLSKASVLWVLVQQPWNYQFCPFWQSLTREYAEMHGLPLSLM